MFLFLTFSTSKMAIALACHYKKIPVFSRLKNIFLTLIKCCFKQQLILAIEQLCSIFELKNVTL